MLIGRLSLRADGARLGELLIDLEEDEPARLQLVAALRRVRSRQFIYVKNRFSVTEYRSAAGVQMPLLVI